MARGFIVPKPPTEGRSYVEVASSMVTKVKHVEKSMRMHDRHDAADGIRFHFARNASAAAAAAAGCIPQSELKKSLVCHWAANRAKRD